MIKSAPNVAIRTTDGQLLLLQSFRHFWDAHQYANSVYATGNYPCNAADVAEILIRDGGRIASAFTTLNIQHPESTPAQKPIDQLVKALAKLHAVPIAKLQRAADQGENQLVALVGDFAWYWLGKTNCSDAERLATTRQLKALATSCFSGV